MTMTEKLCMMESIERRNNEQCACTKPVEVTGNWRKVTKYGNTYIVRVDSDCNDELFRRGCTINEMSGWDIETALKKLNERLAAWNIKVISVKKSILSA